ncbi:MAG: tRNA (guanosine(46)-N7)-methyltransferase TrmB, partial [Sphingomonadales bacterium]
GAQPAWRLNAGIRVMINEPWYEPMSEDRTENKRRVYGRRYGRPLRKRRKALLTEALSRYEINLSGHEPLVAPEALFPRPFDAYWLEIGFGGGEHLAAQATAHSDIGFIGCEPFINGVASLLQHIEEGQLSNVRLLADDARLLLDRMPDASIGRAFVLFPDPWPKKRHARRRIMSPDTVARLARILKPGAELRFASDSPDYVRWTLEIMMRSTAFEWQAERPADWRDRPGDWPATRYEGKAGAAGRPCAYLRFRRLPDR